MMIEKIKWLTLQFLQQKMNNYYHSRLLVHEGEDVEKPSPAVVVVSREVVDENDDEESQRAEQRDADEHVAVPVLVVVVRVVGMHSQQSGVRDDGPPCAVGDVAHSWHRTPGDRRAVSIGSWRGRGRREILIIIYFVSRSGDVGVGVGVEAALTRRHEGRGRRDDLRAAWDVVIARSRREYGYTLLVGCWPAAMGWGRALFGRRQRRVRCLRCHPREAARLPQINSPSTA